VSNKTEFEAVDVDIDDWIDGTSFLQATHTIYRNPAMYAEYGPLLGRIEALEQEIADLTAADDLEFTSEQSLAGEEALTAPASADRALGEKSTEDARVVEARAELERLIVQANEMWEQYSSNVEVWRLRKLDQSERVEITKKLGEPPAEPRGLSKNAKPQAKTAYIKRFDAWYKAMQDYTAQYNLHCLAAATMGVTVAGEDRGGVTVEQMERIQSRPGGADHMLELLGVLERLSTEGVEIVAPHRTGA
jgi:hypothetical protein